MEQDKARKAELADLSNRELLNHIVTTLSQFMNKQAQLVKAEVAQELRSGLFMLGSFGIAGLALFVTLIMLLVAAVLALALVMPGWAAGLIVAGFSLLISLIAALIGWRKRVKTILPHSQQVLKEDVKWTQELLH